MARELNIPRFNAERLARDALTLSQHMIIAQTAVETYGAMMLGYEHPSPLY